MNIFDENSTLMDSTDWLEGLESTNLDDQIFNDILTTDDSLNLQPDLYALDSISSSMHFKFGNSDNNSESSDSSNYSSTGSSSEQQLTAWGPQNQTCSQQHQLFESQSASPHPVSRDAYQPMMVFPETTASETPDYKPVLYAPSVTNVSDTYDDVASFLSQEFVRPPVVVGSSPQPPPPVYFSDYCDEEYVRPAQPNIVYVVQDSERASELLGQQQRCNVSPPRNIVLLPTPLKITHHTVPKCVNPSANRYANKRLLPPNTFVVHRPAPSAISCQEEEEFIRKKEDRKLRNRAAAQMSRLRKRNEFDELKTQLADKQNECSALRVEVIELRRKVARLEAENKELRGLVGSCQPSGELDGQRQHRRTAAVKKASGVFALAFVALMIFPGTIHTPSTVTEVEMSSNKSVTPYIGRYEAKVPHFGHALISLQNPTDRSNATGLSSSPKNLQLFRNASSSFAGCPDGNAFYNSSQNVRLNAELTHWIERHEQMNFVQLRRGNFPSVIFNGRLTTDAMLNTQHGFFKYFSDASTAKWTDTEDDNENDKATGVNVKTNNVKRAKTGKKLNVSKSLNGLYANDEGPRLKEVFNNSSSLSSRRERAQQKIDRERTLRHFDMIKQSQSADNSTTLPTRHSVSAAERQPPTGKSEMLEFTSKIQQKGDTLYVVAMKDYFLLPALDIAKSAPKVSLILPALSANLSAPGQLTMMRIECNVMATSIFYLPDSVISLFNSSSS